MLSDLVSIVQRNLFTLLLAALLPLETAGVATESTPKETRSPPPKSEQIPVTENLHGESIIDPYQWLEEQQSPKTRAWIDLQNKHTDAILKLATGEEILGQQAEALLRTESIGMPIKRGERYFFARRAADQEQFVLYLRDGFRGIDEVLVDPHPLSPDKTTSVSFLDVADDASLVAYGLREGGEDEIAVRLLDVQSRSELVDRLPKARYFGISLLPDKSGFYYTRHTEIGSRVWFHRMGSDSGADEQVFGEGYGPGESISASLSDDGRYLLLTVFFGSAADKTELYLIDREEPKKTETIVAGVPSRFTADFAGEQLVIQSNENTPNGAIFITDVATPTKDSWKLLIAERDKPIASITAAAKRLYVNYLENAQSVVQVFDRQGNEEREVRFPMLGTIGAVQGRWQDDTVFFDFSSFVVPTTIYRRIESKSAQDIWAQVTVPIDSNQFEVKQTWYTSKDGTKVPMFLLSRKGLLESGKSAPALLTGYGGFNLNLTPRFSPMAAIWALQGGVFALPNLRGGGEFGEAWHKGGMREQKQNVFDDFIAAAEYLIQQKYTTPAQLAISGGSNGGLLVGAAITQRPDLFRAALCFYPLLDMVRYHRFLVAKFWVPEYGSSENANQFRTLFAYSPYHRVKEGTKYPAVLFITGDADTRVDPLHARKMAALLQTANASEHPILLRYDTKAGHSGGKPVRQAIDDLAEEMTFLCWQLGVKPTNDLRAGTANLTSPTAKGSGKTASLSESLQRIFKREWEYTLKRQPTFATHLGDKRYNDRWTDMSLTAFQQHYEHVSSVLVELEAIPAGDLNSRDAENLLLFSQHYRNELEEKKYGEHLLPINQRGGVQTADELADSISFETTKDYEDWIARLRSFPAYVDQTIELLREGIRTGRVHPKIIMERISDQLSKQIQDQPERSPFFKPFERFAATVPSADRERLVTEAKTAIQQDVVPAFRKFREFFVQEYFPACHERVGIWQFPEGHAMYASLANRFTTTSLTPAEIHKLGQSEVQRIRKEMETIIKEVGFSGTFAEFLDHLRSDPKFYYKTGDELLEGYRALSKRIDPTLVKLFRKLPRMPYGVEPIPTAIAADTTTAYYRGPAADGSRAGTYFVNLFRPETRPKYEMEALSLHEAVPGHHLQIALAMELGELPEFRRHGGYTAFVEGWGLYAESLGSELGFYQDPYSKFGQLTYEMWRAVRLVVDTGMHELAWSREQAIDFFKANAAKSELDITNEIDRYIAWPGQALAYKIGELKIKELRALATRELEAVFDIRAFHEVVLGSGAVPLDLLESNVKIWIGREKDGSAQ